MKERKFRSASELAAACRAYFDSISAEIEVTREAWEKQPDGKWVKVSMPVIGKDGNRILRTEWFTPPTVGGLCAYLGISRARFSELAKNEKYADAIADARAVITTYLEERISDPSIKNIKGVQISLESIIYAAAKDEAAASTPKLSNEDRAALLREAIENGFVDAE